MTSPNLTIRNVTAAQLRFERVEFYKATHAEGRWGISQFYHNLTVTGSKPSPPICVTAATCYSQAELNLSVAPFKSCKLNVDVPVGAAGEVVALIFRVAEEYQYRVDVPYAGGSSVSFIALTPDPKHEFTGIYVAKHAFLAIFRSARPQSWMKYIKDETLLSSLSIPGTHNSAACYKALPSVRCQVVSPKTQLEHGVRFFDVRVQLDASNSPRMTLVHGAFPVSFTGPKHFRQLLDDIFQFLDHNPSETVIMSVKREGEGSWSGEQLGRVLYDHYTEGEQRLRWYTEPSIPSLGQVRGKIVLMRRFTIEDEIYATHGGDGWGIAAESWADNTGHCEYGAVCVQDFYQVLESVNIDEKISLCQAHLERAASCIAHLPGITTNSMFPPSPQPLYLNFLSASNFWKAGCWPEQVASKLNPAMLDWICRLHAMNTAGDGGTGIVICDWVGADGNRDLVRAVVGFNSMLLAGKAAW